MGDGGSERAVALARLATALETLHRALAAWATSAEGPERDRLRGIAERALREAREATAEVERHERAG